MDVKKKYTELLETPSDINEHLSTLFDLAKEVNSIVELGTRNCASAIAFLAAIIETKKTFVTYDLYRSSIVDELEKYSNFKFCLEDVLEATIPNTDLLFIDTLHTYFQLLSELNLHSANVNKYIVLHDTTSYKHGDEPFYSSIEKMIMSNKVEHGEKRGLLNAIEEFMGSTEGKKWAIHKVYENNNGLTILKRIA
jgi:hypothetical protein